MDFNGQYHIYETYFNTELEEYCAKLNYNPPVLTESMRYSLLSGGKRVRPVLFFSALDAYGYDWRKESGFAIALESIHTYSLIHDDLPAMDNDDFRRGKPSNHKVFGEANAILAGDALLSEAFSLLLKEGRRGDRFFAAAEILADAAGAGGMIAGQSADLLYEKSAAGAEELQYIYAHKTGKLIAAPLTMAATIAMRDVTSACRLGEALGFLFQLTDDILDEKGETVKLGKTVGKDKEEDKLTAMKVYGAERAEVLADEYAAKCRAALDCMDGDGAFLQELVTYVRERNS